MSLNVSRNLKSIGILLSSILLLLSIKEEATSLLSKEAAKNHLVSFFTGLEALQSDISSKDDVYLKILDLCETELFFYDVDLSSQQYDNILFDVYLVEIMKGKRPTVAYPSFRLELNQISLQSTRESITLFSRTDTREQSQRDQFHVGGSDNNLMIGKVTNVSTSAQRNSNIYEELMANADAAFDRKEFRVARDLYLKATKYSSNKLTLDDAVMGEQECFAAIQRENEILLRTQLQDIARAKQLYARRDYEESYELFTKHERNLDQEATYLFGRLLYYNYGNIIRKKGLDRRGTIALGRFYISLAAREDFRRGLTDSKALNLYYQMLRE